MKIRTLWIALAATLATGLSAAPALAQDRTSAAAQAQDAQEAPVTQSQPGRLLQSQRRSGRRNQNSQPEAAAALTPEQINAVVAEQLAAASVSCEITEAKMLGQNAEQQALYETACATGPGYIVIASTPPQAVDCVDLAGQADIERSRDPAADVGLQCTIPTNMDVLRVVSLYATEAGLSCTVDKGASIGKSSGDNIIYEVGCAGSDGAWIEKVAGAWTVTTCLQVVQTNGECRFTTMAEQAATVKGWLAGTDAAACDVTETRLMGRNVNGEFYEAKCGSGEGYIARLNTEKAVQQVYPCAEAARIGGGCKLTTVAAAAPVAAPAPEGQ